MVKIADLGFARRLQTNEAALTNCGTPLHMAPEILFKLKYDRSVDVWSLGTIFYEMLTGLPPFRTRTMIELQNLVDSGDYVFPKRFKLSY
mmetsp:Transcript_6796/g.4893  ORF Transcript_6796/g.4893 Transcript_6796/m.4893 type:complete len:90 (+) Transcript_6796:128-397(+)